MCEDYFYKINNNWKNNLEELFCKLIDEKNIECMMYLIDNYIFNVNNTILLKILDYNLLDVLEELLIKCTTLDKKFIMKVSIENNRTDILSILNNYNYLNIIYSTIIATKTNNIEILKWLLTFNNCNALLIAIIAESCNNLEILKWIIRLENFNYQNILYRVSKSNYDFFNWCKDIIDRQKFTQLCINDQNNTFIQYLIENNIITSDFVVENAIILNNLNTVKKYITGNYNYYAIKSEENNTEDITIFLLDNGANNFNEIITIAVTKNHKKVFDNIVRKIKDIDFLEGLIEVANTNKNYIIRELLCNICNKTPKKNHIIELNKEALKHAYNGSIGILEWLFKKGANNYQEIAEIGAYIGNEDIVKFAIQGDVALNFEKIIEKAFHNKQNKVLKYIANKYKINNKHFILYSILYNNIEILDEILTTQDNINECALIAVIFNNLKVLKLIMSKNVTNIEKLAVLSATYGFIDIVKYFIENNLYNDYDELSKNATKYNHIELLKYLLTKDLKNINELLSISLENCNDEIVLLLANTLIM